MLRVLPGAALALILSLQVASAEPPLSEFATGHVQNFTAHDEPQALAEATFQNADGEKLGFDAFRGKVVLVNLWATWCAPCRHEMPSIDRLAGQLQGDDFHVAAVSVDRRPDKAKTFLEEIGVENLDFYIDPSARLGMALKAFGLPLTLILDREGREIGRLVGPAEWDSPEAIALVRAAIARDKAGS
ncbi:MAG: TlpA family protein disulfide reductase [Minwuia sp.]|uniref:TlpA family protein disulfide reductase n=1 Tax=Minwuia sp. TaxID=2493630 RepID=UPI003A875361